jgi:hypothetical protein
MTPLDQLRLHLRDLAPGSVKDTSTLSDVLESAWGALKAGDTSGLGMEASKLFGRMENVEWNPPVLTFRIERVGTHEVGTPVSQKDSPLTCPEVRERN